MKLTKQRLLSLISQEITNSVGFYGSNLTEQRRNALRYYLGEPLGNEIEGQSQVRSQDMLEVVEAILPSMMRIFTQGESIVRFSPNGPEDVQYAEQSGDYINISGGAYAWDSNKAFDGTVEHVGLRSTTIRMNQNGSVLHIPNSDLASSECFRSLSDAA